VGTVRDQEVLDRLLPALTEIFHKTQGERGIVGGKLGQRGPGFSLFWGSWEVLGELGGSEGPALLKQLLG
jgi:hypothetical protein